MTMRSFTQRLALAGLAAVGLTAGAASPPAHAQPDGYYSDSGGSITVYAPRRLERDPATGAEIDVVRAYRTVDYGDLDLNAPWGVRTLRARVERAASDACDELNNTPGLVIIDSEDCVGEAANGAMERVPVSYAARYHEDGYRY
jgi:UrcA family protein